MTNPGGELAEQAVRLATRADQVASAWTSTAPLARPWPTQRRPGRCPAWPSCSARWPSGSLPWR
jgi:hypothetical protein